jgi:hypothetical protein
MHYINSGVAQSPLAHTQVIVIAPSTLMSLKSPLSLVRRHPSTLSATTPSHADANANCLANTLERLILTTWLLAAFKVGAFHYCAHILAQCSLLCSAVRQAPSAATATADLAGSQPGEAPVMVTIIFET